MHPIFLSKGVERLLEAAFALSVVSGEVFLRGNSFVKCMYLIPVMRLINNYFFKKI